MASWNKQLSKHTKTYLKRLDKAQFSEEELMVFKTICLMSSNSIIYFVDSMKESNPNFTGIKTKQWGRQLKHIGEHQIHQLFEDMTLEYLSETIEAGLSREDFNVVSWKERFEFFVPQQTDNHLVDKAFSHLFLSEVNRNEMPVMTFVEITSALFKRIDAMLVRGLEELEKIKS